MQEEWRRIIRANGRNMSCSHMRESKIRKRRKKKASISCAKKPLVMRERDREVEKTMQWKFLLHGEERAVGL